MNIAAARFVQLLFCLTRLPQLVLAGRLVLQWLIAAILLFSASSAYAHNGHQHSRMVSTEQAAIQSSKAFSQQALLVVSGESANSQIQLISTPQKATLSSGNPCGDSSAGFCSCCQGGSCQLTLPQQDFSRTHQRIFLIAALGLQSHPTPRHIFVAIPPPALAPPTSI